MLRVGVLVSGGGTNLQAILDAIDGGGIKGAEVTAVISNNANAYAIQRAKDHNIPAFVVTPGAYGSREEFNKALLDTVNACKVDLVVLAGFLVKIPEEMIAAYKNRIINIHPSLIPSFCGKGCYGLHVHEKALEYGVKVTGATVHFVNEIPDGGKIISQKAVYIEDGDTPEILQKRVMEQAEWILLPAAAEKVAGEIAEKGENYGHL